MSVGRPPAFASASTQLSWRASVLNADATYRVKVEMKISWNRERVCSVCECAQGQGCGQN